MCMFFGGAVAVDAVGECLARATPALGGDATAQWMVLRDAALAQRVADNAVPPVVALCVPASARDGVDTAATLAWLDTLLTARSLGMARLRDPGRGVAESLGVPPGVEVVAWLAVHPGGTRPPARAASTVSFDGWADAQPLQANTPAIQPPPLQRFLGHGVCESCYPLGACRLGLVAETATDHSLRGTLRMPAAYEGSPGMAHGGFVATVFDDVCSRVAAHDGVSVTGTLEVVYRRPVPVERELAVAGRLAGRDGRRKHVEAEIRDGAEVLARASAVFVDVEEVPTMRRSR